MKIPNINKLNNPDLLDKAYLLCTKGKIKISPNGLFYLDIDDEFIHSLFPLLKNGNIIKPNYFNKNSAGAHISVIYPEETIQLKKEELNQEHRFIIKDLVSAEIGLKTYYVLIVDSLSLLAIRKKYHLPNLLSFKGYSIGFHITIGIQSTKIHD